MKKNEQQDMNEKAGGALSGADRDAGTLALPAMPIQIFPVAATLQDPDYDKIGMEQIIIRLNKAISDSTDAQGLTPAEAAAFTQNCRMLEALARCEKMRYYIMYEIYKTKQWRAEYQSVEEFARKVAGISKSQLMKTVDCMEINIAMHEAGLWDVRPKGRQIEVLAMVPPCNRVDAWMHALKIIRREACTAGALRDALASYCGAKRIRFGRRSPSPTPTPKAKMLKSPHEGSAESAKSVKPPDWIDAITLAEEDVLRRPFGVSEGSCPGRVVPGAREVVKSLRKIAAAADHVGERLDLAEFMEVLQVRDPVLAARIISVAMGQIRHIVFDFMERDGDQSQAAIAGDDTSCILQPPAEGK